MAIGCDFGSESEKDGDVWSRDDRGSCSESDRLDRLRISHGRYEGLDVVGFAQRCPLVFASHLVRHDRESESAIVGLWLWESSGLDRVW
jgi:hypothetical protein